MKEKFILTIMADNRPGLISQITGMLNRKQIDIESINAAKTDVSSVIMITIELLISEKAQSPLQLRLENIIEVYATDMVKKNKAICHRIAYFKLARKILETPQALAIQKFGANIINLYPDAILICKTGCEADILQLYNQLEGKHLLGFMQSGIIVDTPLLGKDEYRVIDLAA